MLHVLWVLTSAVTILSLDYMVEKLGIERGIINDLSNLLYKNYGTTMAGLRVWFPSHFLAQKWNFIAEFRTHWYNLWLFCFIVNSGNWIWLWLWWISQVHFISIITLSLSRLLMGYVFFILVFILKRWQWFFEFLPTVLFMGDYLMRI